MELEIFRPHVLLLIPVFLLLLGLSFFLFRPGKRNRLYRSFILHGLAGALLILALSGAGVQWRTDTVTTVYVVDLSDSAKFYQENAESFIQQSIRTMPDNENAAIVTFGADSRLERFAGNDRLFAGFESIPNRNATNIEEAVLTAMSLMSADTAKRIVLITDGVENAGALGDTASSLLEEKVDVKAVQIEREDTDEVYLSKLDIPSRVSAGDSFSINVEVVSNRSTSAMLYLYSENRVIAQAQVELNAGSNRFMFEDTRQSGGLVTYRASVDALDDAETANNAYYAYTNIQAAHQILVIEGRKGAAAEFEKLLEAVNVNYKTVLPDQAPETIDKMLEYRSAVTVDVHYDDLNKGFTTLIESYVKDYAGGLISIGGENSFALGNYRDTPLETVLPVYMDLTGEKEIPAIAMALVIDRSGSMSVGEGYVTKLMLAKEAAAKALNELRSIDRIGVISFDDGYYWTSEFQSADNRDSIAAAIAGITDGGGTSIYPALSTAVEALKTQDQPIKHIILLTDGQDGFADYQSLLDELELYGITLSTVSVGEDADDAILLYLAMHGNGRYYHTDIRTDIPRIFAQEVYLSTKSYLVNREFTPVISGSHEILSSAGIQSLPSMLGYIASTRKEYANTLLQSDTGDPILTVWQYGLGRTAAFNTDVENRWTGRYAGWEPYSALWKNIIDFTASNAEDTGGNASVEADGSSAVVTYTTEDYGTGTSVSALYTGEDGSTGEFVLHPESPGSFKGVFPTDTTGVYTINIRKEENAEVTGSLNRVYVMQYSQEYRFEQGQNVLPSFLDGVAGKLISTPQEVFQGSIDMVKSGIRATTFLLILALLIFVLDVALRRLNLKLPAIKKISVLPNISEVKAETRPEPEKAIPRQPPNPEEAVTIKKTEATDKRTDKKRGKKENAYLDTGELLNRKKERNQHRKRE